MKQKPLRTAQIAKNITVSNWRLFLPLLIGAAIACLPWIAKAADCFDEAAMYQGIHPGVLRAISIQENSRCDNTVSKNKNGSVDIGCMQINSVHLKELSNHRVSVHDLMDQCKNIYIGAWHYRKMIKKYGNTWTAVGAYHSETPKLRDAYARRVERIFYKYQLWQKGVALKG